MTNPLNQNLYTYVANNPLSYIDPTGHVYNPASSTYYAPDKIAREQYLKWKLGDSWAFESQTPAIQERMWNLAKSDWSLSDAVKWFVAGFVTGLALASPAAILEAFDVATMGTTTASITGGATTLAARATVTVSVAKGAGLFESSLVASSGIKVGGIAEVTVTGKHITLKNIAIYADGVNDSKNLVGAKEIIQWRNAVIEELKRLGYETLTIQGIRVENSTSANPGMTINRTFDLTK